MLAGTGRSGTTWVEEVINHGNAYRVMFEPFHQKKIDLVSHWNYRQYLRPGDERPGFVEPARLILSGRIRDAWIDQFNRRTVAHRRLVKDIRVQLILRWVRARFPEIPILLLLRHPCAVAHSKVKLGWDSHLDDFLAQEELMADHLEPFRALLEGATDDFEKHVLMWCVENYVPLRQFAPGEILPIFYERLCVEPAAEIARILAFIGDGESAAAVEAACRPSAMSRSDSAVVSSASLLESWRAGVSPGRIARTMELMAGFGLDRLYGPGSMPIVGYDGVLAALR